MTWTFFAVYILPLVQVQKMQWKGTCKDSTPCDQHLQLCLLWRSVAGCMEKRDHSGHTENQQPERPFRMPQHLLHQLSIQSVGKHPSGRPEKRDWARPGAVQWTKRLLCEPHVNRPLRGHPQATGKLRSVYCPRHRLWKGLPPPGSPWMPEAT